VTGLRLCTGLCTGTGDCPCQGDVLNAASNAKSSSANLCRNPCHFDTTDLTLDGNCCVASGDASFFHVALSDKKVDFADTTPACPAVEPRVESHLSRCPLQLTSGPGVLLGNAIVLSQNAGLPAELVCMPQPLGGARLLAVYVRCGLLRLLATATRSASRSTAKMTDAPFTRMSRSLRTLAALLDPAR
jgi:hypothetical protein